MKKYTQEEIHEAIRLHRLWLEGSSEGVRADFIDADFINADFSNADFSNADFSNANLRDANLRGADLRGANLRGANLRDGRLGGADLRGARLLDDNLLGADLRGDELLGVNMFNAFGDGLRVKTHQFDKYIVIIYDDMMQIGCKSHSQKQWFNFTDEEISEMDDGALDWWYKHKTIIKNLCEL